MTEPSIIEQMRATLQPRGTAPIVRMHTLNSGMYLNHEFVTSCIDELERVALWAQCGELPNPLEKLA